MEEVLTNSIFPDLLQDLEIIQHKLLDDPIIWFQDMLISILRHQLVVTNLWISSRKSIFSQLFNRSSNWLVEFHYLLKSAQLETGTSPD